MTTRKAKDLIAKETPNPGSGDAIKLGCSCPVLDNCGGRGYMGMPNIFVYRWRCPVHDTKSGKELT